MILQEKVGITPNVAFLTTLRNSGYNNYTAIADIVDNSLDNEVDSKNIKIEFKVDTKSEYEFEYIKIHDDGNGMDYSTLVEALKLGSNTGKLRKQDLGSYGTGMKAAALSIGRRFVIKTKSENDKFYIVEFDLDDILTSGNFEVLIKEGNNEEYDEFIKDTDSANGTSIIISKLDRIDNSSVTSFRNKLIKDFGLFYKIFIEENQVNININGEVVKAFDPMFRSPNNEKSKRMSPLNERFNHNGVEFRFNAYYILKTDNINTTNDFKSKEYNKPDDYLINISRNSRNAGLYIYRNNRLVGSGLDLGIIGKSGDGWLNGLRIELFVDGDSDSLFGSTYTKMIHEKDKSEINQGLRDTCGAIFKQYVSAAKTEEKISLGKNNSTVDDKIKKDFSDIGKTINENKLINIRKKGNNNKKNLLLDKKPTINLGKNKFSNRKRDDRFTDWKYESFGENGVIFKTTIDNGIHVININTDHVFWVEFLKDATKDTKGIIARMFVSMALSLDSIGYYNDSEKEVLLQEYFLEMSSNLRKLIIG